MRGFKSRQPPHFFDIRCKRPPASRCSIVPEPLRFTKQAELLQWSGPTNPDQSAATFFLFNGLVFPAISVVFRLVEEKGIAASQTYCTPSMKGLPMMEIGWLSSMGIRLMGILPRPNHIIKLRKSVSKGIQRILRKKFRQPA